MQRGRGYLNNAGERLEILEYISNAKENKVSESTTCMFLGITPRTIQNWRSKGMTDKRKGSSKFVAHRLTAEEKDLFYKTSNSPRFRDMTPEQIVAILAEEGTYIASTSSLYRILRERKALAHRQESKEPRKSSIAEKYNVTAPNQVYSWDITWLKTDIQGAFKYGYNIIDLYDKTIVGWTVEDNESVDHAYKLFSRIIRDLKVVPEIIHSDNGHPMRGATLAAFFDNLKISRSHSRPRCSNDNAHIESFHKTLKYTVGYPKYFTSLTHARTWYANFINWYNTEHLHSSLGYVTPQQKRTGKSEHIYAQRNQTLQSAMIENPLRWRQGKTRIYQSIPVSFIHRPIANVA